MQTPIQKEMKELDSLKLPSHRCLRIRLRGAKRTGIRSIPYNIDVEVYENCQKHG